MDLRKSLKLKNKSTYKESNKYYQMSIIYGIRMKTWNKTCSKCNKESKNWKFKWVTTNIYEKNNFFLLYKILILWFKYFIVKTMKNFPMQMIDELIFVNELKRWWLYFYRSDHLRYPNYLAASSNEVPGALWARQNSTYLR